MACELRLVGSCKPAYSGKQFRDWFVVNFASNAADCRRRREAYQRMACSSGLVEMRLAPATSSRPTASKQSDAETRINPNSSRTATKENAAYPQFSERRMQCANFSRAKPVAPPPARGAPCRVAACFFGLLSRYSRDGPEDAWLTLQLALPSFESRVVGANPSCSVDTFVHTWSSSAQQEVALRERLKPRAAHFGSPLPPGSNLSRTGTYGWPGGGSPGALASIDRVLELKRKQTEARSPPPNRCIRPQKKKLRKCWKTQTGDRIRRIRKMRESAPSHIFPRKTHKEQQDHY